MPLRNYFQESCMKINHYGRIDVYKQQGNMNVCLHAMSGNGVVF